MPGPVFIVGSLTYIADLNALSAALFSYSVQTVNFTAVRGFIYGLDTDALQITLPLAPAAGDRLMIMPTKAAVLKCTLLRNGQLINDAAADQTIVVPQPMLLTFDATHGWEYAVVGSVNFGRQSANFSALSAGVYELDANALQITLPASPRAGDQIVLRPTGPTITTYTFLRNGKPINSLAADYTITSAGACAVLSWVDNVVGWLVTFDGLTSGPLARVDTTLQELRFHNGQREISAPAGWAPFAMGLGVGLGDVPASSTVLPISGGAVAWPIIVAGHMLLDSFILRNQDTTAVLRTCEVRLYKQRLNNGNAGEATVDEVPNANGNDSFTAGGVATLRTITLGAPVYLCPGIYWLVVRNTSGANTWSVGTTTQSGTVGQNCSQTKTLAGALAATLDFVTGWVKSNGIISSSRLVGRVFGLTALY